ncbi:hypothetical protein ACIHFE_33410 [Streptomyces sp. NPDC052396]|uniref:hypothetical protein n=1 Tax=Streptomyces sp. NPDC052396 TaxID=3365689 RepID=UPI0037D48582
MEDPERQQERPGERTTGGPGAGNGSRAGASPARRAAAREEPAVQQDEDDLEPHIVRGMD